MTDASIGNAVNVGGDEIDRSSFALDLPEASCEVTVETPVRDDTIIGPRSGCRGSRGVSFNPARLAEN
jgi:hypothetical protein